MAFGTLIACAVEGIKLVAVLANSTFAVFAVHATLVHSLANMASPIFQHIPILAFRTQLIPSSTCHALFRVKFIRAFFALFTSIVCVPADLALGAIFPLLTVAPGAVLIYARGAHKTSLLEEASWALPL